jgi:hypothetical protein
MKNFLNILLVTLISASPIQSFSGSLVESKVSTVRSISCLFKVNKRDVKVLIKDEKKVSESGRVSFYSKMDVQGLRSIDDRFTFKTDEFDQDPQDDRDVKGAQTWFNGLEESSIVLTALKDQKSVSRSYSFYVRIENPKNAKINVHEIKEVICRVSPKIAPIRVF